MKFTKNEFYRMNFIKIQSNNKYFIGIHFKVLIFTFLKIAHCDHPFERIVSSTLLFADFFRNHCFSHFHLGVGHVARRPRCRTTHAQHQ